MKKQIFTLLLSLLLVVSLPFSALADVASGSNAVYGDPFSDRLDTYSSIANVENTLTPKQLNLTFDVFDSVTHEYKRLVHTVATRTNDGYRFNLSGVLSENEHITSLYFGITHSLPSPAGNYKLEIDLSSDISFDADLDGEFRTTYQYGNSILMSDSAFADSKQFSHGDSYLKWNSISIRSSYNSAFCILLFKNQDTLRNLAGWLSVRFVPVAEPGTETAGPTVSQQDYQSGVSDSLSNIGSGIGDINTGIGQLNQTMEYVSQSQDLIIKGIDNIILHISDQLYAFWDQLYNLIHVPTMAKLDQILQAIKDMDINVNVDLDELKSAISSAASKITGQIQSSINSQITNDDKNTDHLENGYDNSGILGDKGKLDGAITEYEKVEDQLISDAKDKIGKFEFDNPFEKYTGPLSDISYFLTGIYNGLQGLNIPVSFSLTLTIALVFIGYYRFKGGA